MNDNEWSTAIILITILQNMGVHVNDEKACWMFVKYLFKFK